MSFIQLNEREWKLPFKIDDQGEPGRYGRYWITDANHYPIAGFNCIKPIEILLVWLEFRHGLVNIK